MKNGKTPLPSSFRVRDFQRSVVPLGRDREPGFGPEQSTPARCSIDANSFRSDRCMAQPTNAGLFRLATWRGSVGAGCKGSGARISKYRCVPRDSRAFFVPAPGCTPPAAARTPVRWKTYSMPASKSLHPKITWSRDFGTLSGAGHARRGATTKLVAARLNTRRETRCMKDMLARPHSGRQRSNFADSSKNHHRSIST